MKTFSQFLKESVETAQKAWQDWLNSPAGVRAGKVKSNEEMSKAAKEFMKTYMKTGKAPGWAGTPPPSGAPKPGTAPKPAATPPKPPASGTAAAPKPGATPPKPPASGTAAAPKPGAGGLKNVAGRVVGPAVSGYVAYDEYNQRRNQGQSEVQAAGGALSGWGGSVAASKSAAKLLSPLLAAPFPGARPLYGLGVLGAGALGYYGAGKGFDAFYNRAKNAQNPGGAGPLGTTGDALGSRPTPPKPQNTTSTPPKPQNTTSTLPKPQNTTPTSPQNTTPTPPKPQFADLRGGDGKTKYGDGTPINPIPTPPQNTTPTPPKPKPQKSARQKELDAINADKTLTPREKWEKANPKLATAQKEKERIRGTAQSDNPLLDRMKLRSGMRAGSPTVQDPKVQQLGKGYQRLANNPNAARAANPSLLSRSMQSSRPTGARKNARPLSLNVS